MCLLSFFRPKPKRSQAAQELLAAVQGKSYRSEVLATDGQFSKALCCLLTPSGLADNNRGVSSSKQAKLEILQIADALQAENEGMETTTDAISATWRLLWTTEKASS